MGGLFKSLLGKGANTSPNPKIMIDLHLSEIKVGGLRFALGLHLMGMQNTPTKGSWKANQSNDGVLDLFYADDSASLAINFDEDLKRIRIERWGTQPSLQYVLQESLVLHSIIDELDALAFGNTQEIEDKNRLLVLKDNEALEKARAALPARKA